LHFSSSAARDKTIREQQRRSNGSGGAFDCTALIDSTELFINVLCYLFAFASFNDPAKKRKVSNTSAIDRCVPN
jgi:hypothetical protein